jgi:serine/threonine protein kinase
MAAAAVKQQALGAGAFGCTLKPDYPCANVWDNTAMSARKKSDKSYVSKVLDSKNEMDKEWAHYELAYGVDPESTFTVPLIGHCTAEVPVSDLRTITDKNKCSPATDKLLVSRERYEYNKLRGQLYQIIGEFAGVDFTKAIKTETLRTLLHALTPVIQGIAIMAENNIYHRDIKLGNIMYMNDAARLIDFGYMTESPELVYIFDVSGKIAYETWPPECDLLYSVKHDRDKLITNASKALYILKNLYYFGNKKTKEPYDEEFEAEAHEYAQGRIQNGTAAMKRTLLPHLRAATAKGRYREALKVMGAAWGSKFDVFSIGLVVAKIASTRWNVYGDDIRPEFLMEWIEHTMDFNADTRWSAAHAASEWLQMLEKTFRHMDPGDIPLRTVGYNLESSLKPADDGASQAFPELDLNRPEFETFFTSFEQHPPHELETYDLEADTHESASKAFDPFDFGDLHENEGFIGKEYDPLMEWRLW